MTRDFCAVSGEEMNINNRGCAFLGKLTIGLWEWIGIYEPMSKDDTLLMARILRNYAKIQRETHNCELNRCGITNQYFFWHTNGHRQEDMDTIEWLEKVADFLENSGGLVSEDEYMRIDDGHDGKFVKNLIDETERSIVMEAFEVV